jgi:hypothetical protein
MKTLKLKPNQKNIFFFVMTLMFCFGMAFALIASIDVIGQKPSRAKLVEATLFSNPATDLFLDLAPTAE